MTRQYRSRELPEFLKPLVRCSGCGNEYRPKKKAPKVGQRRFCADCKERGVDSVLRARAFRRRQRRKAKEQS